MRILLFPAGVFLLLVSVSGCGGSKVLKESEPLVLTQSLAAASDERLSVTLEWVIVRDGPGTWAKNADWDEYLFRAHNLSDNKISIDSIVVFDSLETRIESNFNRKQLVKGSKSATKRYKGEGLNVKAGLGGVGLVAVGGATYAAGFGALAATGVVGAVGAVVVAPVLVVGGVFRAVNNSKVSREIESRSTELPLVLSADSELALDIFFPLSPSPVRIEVHYSDTGADYVLSIDTTKELVGLHLSAPEREQTAD